MDETGISITGSVAVPVIMAVVAGFLTQAVKQAIPERYHRYIPIPLAVILCGAGVLLAWLQGTNPVDGGTAGIVAAALAVYGYQVVKGFVRPDTAGK